MSGRSIAAAAACTWVLTTACISADFQVNRETETSGRFDSTARSWTILSWDFPKDAELIARENISDARLTNVRIEAIDRRPDWIWWLAWIPELLWSPSCRITGTWGFPPAASRGEGATPGSTPGS